MNTQKIICLFCVLLTIVLPSQTYAFLALNNKPIYAQYLNVVCAAHARSICNCTKHQVPITHRCIHPYFYLISNDADLCLDCEDLMLACSLCTLSSELYYTCPLCKSSTTKKIALFHHLMQKCAQPYDLIQYDNDYYIILPSNLARTSQNTKINSILSRMCK